MYKVELRKRHHGIQKTELKVVGFSGIGGSPAKHEGGQIKNFEHDCSGPSPRSTDLRRIHWVQKAAPTSAKFHLAPAANVGFPPLPTTGLDLDVPGPKPPVGKAEGFP